MPGGGGRGERGRGGGGKERVVFFVGGALGVGGRGGSPFIS